MLQPLLTREASCISGFVRTGLFIYGEPELYVIKNLSSLALVRYAAHTKIFYLVNKNLALEAES